MRIVFMGTPDFSVPSLQALIDAGYDVVGVFTQPDRPKGRGGKVQMSPVKELALKYAIPVFQPFKIRADGLEALEQLAPDLCVTAAFGQILSQAVLDVPKLGTVNVHASLLPRHRGAAPVQWAILLGDAVTGVTTMFTDKGIDTGDMLLRKEIAIHPTDTAGTLLETLSSIGAELLIETIRQIESGTCPREKQNEELASYDPMLKKEMGELDFTVSSKELERRVRAMSPWPCAYIPLCDDKVLKVWRCEITEDHGVPGTILSADRKGIVVACGEGAVRLLEIQAPNGKRMEASAFLRGHPLQNGMKMSEVQL